MGCSASTTESAKKPLVKQNNNSSTIANSTHDQQSDPQLFQRNHTSNQDREDWEDEPSKDEEPEPEHYLGYEDDDREQEAATKIQSNYRGYKTRKQLRRNKASKNSKKMKEDETNNDEHKAATRIQAGFKGYKVRKDNKKSKSETNSEEGSPKKATDKDIADEIADIDLNDPEVEKAAQKIQATFRGYKGRREPRKE